MSIFIHIPAPDTSVLVNLMRHFWRDDTPKVACPYIDEERIKKRKKEEITKILVDNLMITIPRNKQENNRAFALMFCANEVFMEMKGEPP